MIDVHETVFIGAGAVLTGDVTIGEGSSVWFNAVLRADLAPIRIGKNSAIEDNVVIHGAEAGLVEIADNVTVGHSAILHSCTIEDDALIGMGAIVMNRAHIGRGAVVGAGAVVLAGTEIPDGMLAVGNPAKVVKAVSPELTKSNAAGIASYLKLSKEQREGTADIYIGR